MHQFTIKQVFFAMTSIAVGCAGLSRVVSDPNLGIAALINSIIAGAGLGLSIGIMGHNIRFGLIVGSLISAIILFFVAANLYSH